MGVAEEMFLFSRPPWCYLADGTNEDGISWEYCYETICKSTLPVTTTTLTTLPQLNFTSLGSYFPLFALPNSDSAHFCGKQSSVLRKLLESAKTDSHVLNRFINSFN